MSTFQQNSLILAVHLDLSVGEPAEFLWGHVSSGVNTQVVTSGFNTTDKLRTAFQLQDRIIHSLLPYCFASTAGDYRHWVTVQGRRLSHTMDPRTGAPLAALPASVTVVAPTCAEADAWATALMVAGPSAGAELAARHDLDALFLLRGDDGGLQTRAVGCLFGGNATAAGEGQA